MAGDYTRFTFKPEHDHSTVFMQQGRVQVDADWNELAEVVYRRLRAETVDIMGRCAVPRNPGAAPGDVPTGFLIQAAAGSFTIGIGRAYVDGLLAENRGRRPLAAFEPIWDEPIGTQPTPYTDQPYRVDVTDPAGAGPHLFYLDVWDREVTAVENAGLVDPAVGVDTATRLQTVWQVRTLQVGAGVTCATDWSTVQAWVDLTRPSGARLTTADIGTPASTDPCLVLPSGGYRGIDNRLYRIEIHDAGTIKWSRTNAAVAARVTGAVGGSAAAPVVPVETIGHDAILRFHPGDWIELVDRKRELDGNPGIVVKIAPDGVDGVRLELRLEAVTAPVFTQLTALGAETRVRRWDTRPGDASALIPFVSGTPINLEDGVQVTVDVVAPGVARTGDYWIFTARAADASVEVLDHAPPRGIRHHYCRLAVLSGGNLEDCRVIYPPECPPPVTGESCDCDVCVTPESHADGSLTIQDAIDKVRATGGKVCLHAGVYELEKAVEIVGAESVQLVGKGLATVLFMRGEGPAIDVYRSVEVTIEHLAVATSGRGGDARTPEIGIAVRSAAGVTVQRCFIAQMAGFEREALLSKSRGPAAFGRGGVGIGLAGLLVATVLRENVIIADIGIGTLTTDRAATWEPGRTIAADKKAAAAAKAARPSTFKGMPKLGRSVFTWGLFIEDNLLACFRVGVDLGRSGRSKGPVDKTRSLKAAVVLHLGDTRIAGNTISGCVEAGIIASGTVAADPDTLAAVLRAIPARAAAAAFAGAGRMRESLGVVPMLGSGLMSAGGSRLDIVGNILATVGHGVAVGCDATRIANNDISGREGARTPSTGILLLAGARRVLRRALIAENRITGMSGYGIAVDTYVASALIKLNIVERTGIAGIVCTERAGFEAIVVENNLLRSVGVTDDDSVFTRAGIVVVNGAHAELIGNTLVEVAPPELAVQTIRIGILALSVGSARAHGNTLDGVGPGTDFLGAAAGIAVDVEGERIDVADNEVRLVGVGNAAASAVELGMPSREVTVLGSLLLVGSAWTRASDFPNELTIPSPLDKPDGRLVSAHGNHLEADGRRPVVLVSTPGTCHFADNRVVGAGEGSIGEILAGAGAVVSANVFSSGQGSRLLVGVHPPAAGNPAPATIVGNLGPHDIELNGAALAAPWSTINVPH
jgi:uncharacterized protein DUF6519/parallel beta helix pectate lyase-like protein